MSSHLPRNWRDRLPHPDTYYRAQVEKLGRANGGNWAQGKCPFHEDGEASLSVHMEGRGHWKCFAGCGHGDLVAFAMRKTGRPFAEAVRDLIGGIH